MIKLKTTKNKFIATINAVGQMAASIRNNKKNLKDWPLVQANAHLFVLEEISRKMRSKMIMLETKRDHHAFTYSINEIHGLVFITNKGNFPADPYTMSVIEEISNIIFLKLLS